MNRTPHRLLRGQESWLGAQDEARIQELVEERMRADSPLTRLARSMSDRLRHLRRHGRRR